MGKVAAVILAAGKGTRMKSEQPKVLHHVCGKTMIKHVCDTVKSLGVARTLVVVGYQADKVKEAAGDAVEYVLQAEQLGTGHAVLQTEAALRDFDGQVLVLYGDTPLLTPETLRNLLSGHIARGSAATILTAELSDPTGYGRIIRRPDGAVAGIVEQKDATPAEAAVREINTGIYCFDSRELFPALHAVRADNTQREYYLTDVIGILGGKGRRVDAVAATNPGETLGINSRRQLAELEAGLRRQIREYWLAEGVTMLDPASTFIDADVSIGADTVLYPFTLLEGGTVIGTDCVIGPQVRISNTQVGCGAKIENAVVVDSFIADAATVGPFAYIRPGTVVETGAKVGTFVEVKKSAIGRGSKVPHLSYVGDGVIGKGVNIGAGTIFVNYDSREKHQTVVEDGAFVGCNTNLIAPVTVRRGSYIAAGSTITKEVPEEALGIARSRQENILGWVRKWRDKTEKAAKEKNGD